MEIKDKISGPIRSAAASIKSAATSASALPNDIKKGVGMAKNLIKGVADTAECVVDNFNELTDSINGIIGLYDEVKDAIAGIMGAFQDVPKLLESRFVGGPRDILAVADVYEITEHAVRTRASQLIDSIIKKLLNLARISDSFFDDCFTPILDYFKAVFDFIKSRIEKYLGKFSPGTKERMSDVVIDYTVLGYCKLDLFWDYRDEIIAIPPAGVSTYTVVLGILNTNLGTTNESPLATALDTTAETIVFATLINDMLKYDINAPIGEILAGLTNDNVRDNVCTLVFPNAINPTGLPGPLSTELINGPTDAEGNPLDVTAPTTDHPIYIPDLDIDPDFIKPVDPTLTEDTVLDIFIDTAIEDILPLAGDKWRSDITYIPGINDFTATTAMCSVVLGGKTWSYTVIEELLKHVTADALFARYPGLIQALLYFYRLPDTAFILETEYTKLLALINKLKPLWYTTLRNGSTIGWLPNLAYCSSDALHLFSSYTGSQLVETSLIAGTYRNNDIMYLLKQQYPLAAI